MIDDDLMVATITIPLTGPVRIHAKDMPWRGVMNTTDMGWANRREIAAQLRTYLGDRARIQFDRGTKEVLVARTHIQTLVTLAFPILLMDAVDPDPWVRVRWQVLPGTGTCTAACWEAKHFECSCVCGGERHQTGMAWTRVGPTWLEGRLNVEWTEEELAEIERVATS
jgi:hypothetical protein